jgi:hypothetical protein
MRVNDKELLKNIDKENHRNKLLEFEEKVKLGVFGLFYLLLKNHNSNIWVETFYLVLIAFQLISFSFDEVVIYLFNLKKLV